MKIGRAVAWVVFAVVASAGGVGAWSACGSPQRSDGGRGLLPENSIAPEFRAPDQTGRERALSEFRGKPVVLYFYPRDGTPGCTREACAFRDAWSRLSATGAEVVGVSSNSVASHAQFAREHGLQFPLLADVHGRIAQSYGVGSFLGLDSRVTFIISPDGHVVRVFPHVDPAIHADEVIAILQRFPPPASATVSVAAPLDAVRHGG